MNARMRWRQWLTALAVLLLLAAPVLAQRSGVVVEAWRGVSESTRLLFDESVTLAASIMETQLGLPLQGTAVRYVVFPDRPALLEGYQSLLGYTGERAEPLLWTTGRTIRASSGVFIFTRIDGFGPAGPDRPAVVRHVAHELTHVVQRAVKLCPQAAAQWIIEGWAEWAGFRVVDIAGLRPYAQLRAERLEVIRRAWNRAPPPALVQLDGLEWSRLAQAWGSSATYGIAFLAVERLIELPAGPAGLDGYCAAARTDGRWIAFERTFGQSEPDFALEFTRYMQTLMGQ